MAINPNNGVLDIINGTLKVSSIDIKQAAGFTTALNTVARNDVLLFDDQKATTVFTPTSEGGYMSSTGVTRDTTEGAGYIDLNDGWVYWPLQLPNSWHTEFDMHVTTTGGVLTFSLFNTSEPNHTDYTNNDGGYKIVFDNTTNKLILYYEGSPHKLGDVNIRSPDWQHVNINYFQGAISVSLAGKVVLTHEFTQNYQEFNSRYVGFSATAGASHKIRHLRVHNSDKWLYTKTSNASDITYVSGNVGIGSLSPTELLDVHGNVHIARDLTVDGNLTVSGTTTFIDTQNLAIEDPIIEVAKGNASDTIDAGLVITRATSNVAVAYRGDEEELALGYTQSGASDTDVTPITDGGLDVRVYGNLFANNLTTTANVEATYLKGDGSEITHVTLDQVVGYGNVTSNTIQLAGLTATGNVEANYFVGDGSKLTGLVTDLQYVTDNGNTSSNTIQFTNATTAFVADSNVGIGTDTPAANLHVVGHQYVNDPPTLANSFDHSDAPLTLTHGTPTSTTAIDDPKAVLHLTRDGTSGESYGARASFNLSRYENSGTASRSRLDVALADGTYAETNVMSIRADGKVGIGTTAPAYELDVHGTANVGTLTTTTMYGEIAGSNALTASTGAFSGDLEVGTANLFVDTTTSNVGVGTDTPLATLDIQGDVLINSNLSVGPSSNLFVDATTGNVGISNTAPVHTLDIGSNVYVQEGGDTVLYVSGNVSVSNKLTVESFRISSPSSSGLQAVTTGVGANTTSNPIVITNAVNSTSTTTGALTLTNGGLGVVGDIYAGGTLTLASDLAVDGSTLKVDAAQNRVGILTTNPGFPLDVHGAANVGALTTTYVSGDGSGITNILSSSVNDFSSNVTRIAVLESGDLTIGGEKTFSSNLEVGTANLFVDTVSGRVGVGTTTPDLELHVHDANNAHSGIILSSTTGYHRLYASSDQLYFQSGTAASADSRADINFTSMYASTTYMKILGSNGNVGIGLTNPTAKLHVNGGITKTQYNPGEVIEELHAPCNSTSLHGRATIQNVTGYYAIPQSYGDATGSVVTNYTPPTGTKTIVYEFVCMLQWVNAHAISHWRLYFKLGSGSWVEVSKARYSRSGYYPEDKVVSRWVFTYNASSADNSLGVITGTPVLSFKWMVRDYGVSNQRGGLHQTSYWDGDGTDMYSQPMIMIKAIA